MSLFNNRTGGARSQRSARALVLHCSSIASGDRRLGGTGVQPVFFLADRRDAGPTIQINCNKQLVRTVPWLLSSLILVISTFGALAADKDHLSDTVVVRLVLERNPSLAQMTAAWQMATARYPQVTSLDDPMLGVTLAPGAWGSSSLNGGFRVEMSQKYPWYEKRALRGQGASAEASAASHDLDDMRLQLVESARTAFADYYLVSRSLEVNAESLQLLEEFQANAKTRYQSGLVPQQDLLQADVEIGRQRERQLTLRRTLQVAIARINTLVHLPPETPLPPPPEHLGSLMNLPDVAQLRALALNHRPDLHALADRIRADEAALGVAQAEYVPDVELMAAYDAIWQEKALRPQVAVRLNLPVRTERRCAAVAEARARLAQRQAELARQLDQVSFQVQESWEQVHESEQTVRLYRDTILPAAQTNVRAAQSAYVAGKTPFLSLLEAQRSLVELRDRAFMAEADLYRRQATLMRIIGGASVAPGLCTAPGASAQ